MLSARSQALACGATSSPQARPTRFAVHPTWPARCSKPMRQALARSMPGSSAATAVSSDVYGGIHHVGVLCQDLPASLRFYCDILGMELNPARPDGKLPYKGAWLWVGEGMIHLMELPNPDPAEGRPEHGGRDRHVCLSVRSIAPIEAALKAHGIAYTKSQSGRAALFFRDPDSNVLEMAEQ